MRQNTAVGFISLIAFGYFKFRVNVNLPTLHAHVNVSYSVSAIGTYPRGTFFLRGICLNSKCDLFGGIPILVSARDSKWLSSTSALINSGQVRFRSVIFYMQMFCLRWV